MVSLLACKLLQFEVSSGGFPTLDFKESIDVLAIPPPPSLSELVKVLT